MTRLIFNIALLPENPDYQTVFSSIAQTYFGRAQDGYVLSTSAAAHITLCQFSADGDRAARDAFATFKDRLRLSVKITEFRFREGREEHQGFVWAEFLVEKSDALSHLQRRCHEHLLSRGLESRTPTDLYSPHITLARLRRVQEKVPSIDDIPSREWVGFRPAVGRSTENGVFTSEL